jgi:hypothetical protein
MKVSYSKKLNTIAIASATLLMSSIFVPAASAEVIHRSSPSDFSRVAFVNALKDDYLSQACRSNNLGDLLSKSYGDFVGNQDNQFKDQYWYQFTDDAGRLSSHSKSWSKWLKKNRSKFPKSARASVSALSRDLTKEIRILKSLVNAPTMDDLYFAWNQYDRHLFNASYSSGQIRKALKLPSRIGINACP